MAEEVLYRCKCFLVNFLVRAQLVDLLARDSDQRALGQARERVVVIVLADGEVDAVAGDGALCPALGSLDAGKVVLVCL